MGPILEAKYCIVETADGSVDVEAIGSITATQIQSLTDSDSNDIVLTANTGSIY